MERAALKASTFAYAIVTLIAFSLSIAVADLQEGLVVHFNFNQGETDAISDLSNTGNNGVVMGNPMWVDGPGAEFGKAIQFNGIDDYIEVADSPTLDVGDGDISFVLWILQDANQETDHPRPMSKMPLFSTDKPGFDLITFGNVSAAMQVFYGMSGGARQALNAVKNIVDGQWHHLVAMKDGSEIKLYIDGELDSSAPATAIDINNDYPLTIGTCAQVAAHVMFKGAVDEVAFYNRALTEDEIQLAMQGNIAAAVKPEEKLSITWGSLKR